MNNKGFAITTILYGTLILFLMLLLSMLGMLNTYKGRLEKLVDANNGARGIINGEISVEAQPSKPVLDSGMIPVTIADDGTVKTISKDDSKWYDYSSKKWANVVLVTEANRSTYQNTSGVTIPEDDILGYFVWIPRYKYKIWYTGGDNQTGNEQEIDIVFESSSTAKSRGNAVGEYLTHPAFTFGSKELSGFWVGKFETTGTADIPTVKPNLFPLRNQNISAQFQTALKFAGGTLLGDTVSFAGSTMYGLSPNTDSHMMKNSEWGAVAYLSHSKYGVNREVYINNSSSYYTGRSGGNVAGSTPINGTYTSETSTNQFNTYGFYDYKGCLLDYDTGEETTTCNITKVASSTGNITGIYDMSGGAWEYTMGNYNYNTGKSGFTTFPNIKYYDNYTGDNFSMACNSWICFGHALSETKKWYSDYAEFISSSSPWSVRGGYHYEVYSAGTFFSDHNDGRAASIYSFRVVLSR